MEQLIEAVQQGVLRLRRDRFKALSFDGRGDVNYFIEQFTDVADANRWDPQATRLHLPQAREGAARDCGQADKTGGIFDRLRT